MRSIFAVATAVLLFSAGVELVHAGGCSGKRGRLSLSEGLGLTEDQQTALAEIRETFSEQKQAVNDDYRTGLEEILTAEQLEAIETIRSESPRRRITAGDIGLTEEQIASLTSLREEMVAQKQALREEYRDAFEELLTPEQLELLAERGGRFGGHKRDDVDEDGGAGDDGGSTSDQLSLQASTVPTAVEETSWGSIKSSLR